VPRYAFKCFEHNKSELVWRSVENRRKSPACPMCMAPMERDYPAEHQRHIPASAFPFVTKNIDPNGKPIEVTSAAHLDSLCKQYNVTHRPDVAYEEDESYTDEKGQWRVKAGTGRGLPGSWFGIVLCLLTNII
jgi:hypothetical protein